MTSCFKEKKLFTGLEVVHIKFICRVHDVTITNLFVHSARLCPYLLLLNIHVTTNYNEQGYLTTSYK